MAKIKTGQGKALGSITLEAFKSVRPEEWVVRAIVRDRDGNLAPNVLVNFNVDNGFIREPDEEPPTFTQSIAVETNVNGIAEVVLTDAYWATIHARVEEVELSAVVSIYDYVESGEIIIDAPDVVAGHSEDICATVLGRDGYPLRDIPVTFESASGVMEPPVVLTDLYGEACSTLTVGQSGSVRVWASVGNISHSRLIRFDVDPYPITITTTTPPVGNAGVSYSFQMQATGGLMPYTWNIIDGSLPDGLTLSSSGLVYGYPATAGTFSFMVEVEDSDGLKGFANLTINIQTGIPDELEITTTSPLTRGTVGLYYSTHLQARGGTPPYQWNIISGILPGGLSLETDSGYISGTPSNTGRFSINVEVSDAQGSSDTSVLELEIVVN